MPAETGVETERRLHLLAVPSSLTGSTQRECRSLWLRCRATSAVIVAQLR